MTETSRRSLLRAGATVAVLAPFVPAGTAEGAKTSVRFFRRSRFTPLRKRSFTITAPSGSWAVRLEQVSDLPYAPRGDEDRFVLTFRTAAVGPPQGSYVLRRSRFAPTTLFLVPSDAGRRTYEAVVNRAP